MNDQREGYCTHRPPYANRGSVSASGGRYAGVHWFTATAFVPSPEPLLALVEGVLERFGTLPEWEKLGPKGRVSETHLGPQGLRVNEFYGAGDFCQVELPGQACEAIGDAGLSFLVESMSQQGWRWHATRIDGAFDGVRVTPREAFGLLETGMVNTRCKLYPTFIPNEEGTTCYTAPRTAARFVRIYDRRGETRVEGVWKRDQAKALGAELATLPVDQWGRRLLGALRAYVDFVDRSANPQACRCPLLPWWSDLVGAVDRQGVSLPPSEALDPEGLELVGWYDGRLQAYARRLCEAAAAFGWEWVRDRAEVHGLDLADRDRVRRLKGVRAQAAKHRIAGVQPWPDGQVDSEAGEIPF